MADYEPKLVCFSCKFGWGYLSDDKKSGRIKNLIPVACTGKIDATHIINAFKEGADGILILGCPEGDCHFQNGNFTARNMVILLKKTLEQFGIEPERLRMEFSLDPEGTKIPQFIEEMCESIKNLGPTVIERVEAA